VKDEITSSGMTSKLMLRKTRRQDSAVFHCIAENKFGKGQRTVTLTVQVTDSTRVTRLAEFSPIGRLFSLGSFLIITEVGHIFRRLLSAEKAMN
jgi:hypothetical protein